MNPSRCLTDADERMHTPTPDVEPDPAPPDSLPRPIGDPPNQRPPEYVRAASSSH